MRPQLVWIAALLTATALAAHKQDSLMDQAKEYLRDALMKAPQDQEVCFSPDNGCDLKLVKFIQTAQKTLDIAVYDLTHPQLTHEILMASRRVSVRILVDQRQAKGEHSLVSTLIKGKLAVRFGRQRGIMHNKFMIVDGKMVETGSYNYTTGATSKNNENQIYLASPQIVDQYKQRFETIWTAGAPARLPGVDPQG